MNLRKLLPHQFDVHASWIVLAAFTRRVRTSAAPCISLETLLCLSFDMVIRMLVHGSSISTFFLWELESSNFGYWSGRVSRGEKLQHHWCFISLSYVGLEVSKNRILKWFTGDLFLRETFHTQILPNAKQLWISMHSVLLNIHFMMLLKKTYSSKIS